MAFNGTVQSDYLKLVKSSLNKEKLINYSASDYVSIRDALIEYAKATFPLDYTNFVESDFGVFLIELMAAVGHIQSIKSDYLANECFLPTARSRASVKKLLELIGVRMKGPIAAAANAEITITGITIPSASSVTITPENRIVTVTSPEDNSTLTFTLYKVNPNGSISLDNNQGNLTFNISPVDGNATITDAVLLEGSLVIETGTFNVNDTVKSVKLSRSPYIEKSAQVFITGNQSTEGEYTEEENIYYASGSEDKIFQVLTDDNFVPTILFGDNTVGLSPAVEDQFTIIYRVGGGSRGNIISRLINFQPSVEISNGTTTEDIVATATNSSIATGGSDAETVTHAKRYAPLTFRRQDRLVTVTDYKSFANSFASTYGSTGKANAVVRRAYSSANIIDIFVLEKASDTQLRRASSEYKRQLLEAMSDKKMITDEPVVVDGLIRTLDLFLTINLEEKYRYQENTIKGLVRDIILGYFNVDNFDFGIEFSPEDLVRTILELDQVRFATVDNVKLPIKVSFNEIIQLNNFTINVDYI